MEVARMKKKESLNALLMQALAETRSKGIETPPEGWLTIEQWADECGAGRRTTADRIATLVKAGRMEVRKYRTRSGPGTTRVNHYFLLSEKTHHTAD